MTQCSPPAPASTSSFPLAPHVEPELHPHLHVDRSELLLTASTERDSGSSMRLAPLLLAATASTTSTSTRDESATRRISTVCGEPDKWRSGQCELGQSERLSTSSNHWREEASKEAWPQGQQNSLSGNWSRAEHADPRDPRAQGHPCYGTLTAMAEGRGFVSGRNGHARWQVCETCRLRILYVPVHGAKGILSVCGTIGPGCSDGSCQCDPGCGARCDSSGAVEHQGRRHQRGQRELESSRAEAGERRESSTKDRSPSTSAQVNATNLSHGFRNTHDRP